MKLFGCDIHPVTDGGNDPFGLIPLVERAIAASDSRLTDRGRHEHLQSSPAENDAVSAHFVGGNLVDMDGQKITHTRLPAKQTNSINFGSQKDGITRPITRV